MPPAPPHAIGSVIAGRYEVRGHLGSGQHGEVWRVHDVTMDAEYALKLLNPSQISGPWAEAHLLNNLSGDFILRIRNADTTSEGMRYLVTDVAKQGSVIDRIHPVLGIPENQAVKWVREACNGLARVHRQGLLHRDVKPENLFLSEAGRCMVGDLSLAGTQNESGCAGAGGTLQTMAPEVGQVALSGYSGTTETYSVRSEVFSLGATLYWMLCGQPPIDGGSYEDAFRVTVEDIWNRAPHVSRGVRDVVMKSLDRDPARRFPTPTAMAAALGARSQPERQWIRVDIHSEHERCLEGARRGKSITLCILSQPNKERLLFQVRYTESGRRHPMDGREAAASRLNQSIRSCIRDIS